jgi:hypothetical protein
MGAPRFQVGVANASSGVHRFDGLRFAQSNSRALDEDQITSVFLPAQCQDTLAPLASFLQRNS